MDFTRPLSGVKVFRPVTDFRLWASQSGCSCDSYKTALKKIGGIGPDHMVQMLRTLFCGHNQVMFQRTAAAWKSNQIILSDSNIVLHILKDVMILKFFHWSLHHTPSTMNQSQFRSKIHSKSRLPTW